MTQHQKRNGFIHFVVELVIVFVGVYAAFGLDQYQERMRKQERTKQYVSAMKKDFAANRKDMNEQLPAITSYINNFLQKYNKGNMPKIEHFSMGVSFRANSWNAILRGGGMDLLRPKLIFQVEDFYNRAASLAQSMQEAKQWSTALILPYLSKPKSFFYDEKTRRLRPQFYWYPEKLREFRNGLLKIQNHNNEILKSIEQYSL